MIHWCPSQYFDVKAVLLKKLIMQCRQVIQISNDVDSNNVPQCIFDELIYISLSIGQIEDQRQWNHIN